MHWTGSDIGGVAAAATATGALVLWAWRKGIRPLTKFVDEFRDDWKGTPARPGVKARPGVMERLESIEGQLRPNGGTSMHDAVNRIEQQLAAPAAAAVVPEIHIHPAAGSSP